MKAHDGEVLTLTSGDSYYVSTSLDQTATGERVCIFLNLYFINTVTRVTVITGIIILRSDAFSIISYFSLTNVYFHNRSFSNFFQAVKHFISYHTFFHLHSYASDALELENVYPNS
jgi:hypothetical protein